MKKYILGETVHPINPGELAEPAFYSSVGARDFFGKYLT